MKKKLIIIGFSIFVLWGCTLKEQANPTKGNEVSVVGNMIYRYGKPYAELRFFDTNMVEILTESTRVDGLVIYYFDIDKEIWIYPSEGLNIVQNGKKYSKIDELKRVYGKYLDDHAAVQRGERRNISWPTIYIGQKKGSKEDAIRLVYGVRISSDGKYVYYNVQGVIWNSSHKFPVAYDALK